MFGSDKVKEATRLRVLKVINESAIAPTLCAGDAHKSKPHRGVAVSRITNPIVPEILKAWPKT